MIDGQINSLSEKETKQVAEILKLKKDIMSYINMNDFIEETRKIIDNSSIFEFRSKVARMYIDKKNPSFALRIKDDLLLQNLLKEKDPRDRANKLLQKEIINNISKLLTESLDKSNNKVFNEFPKELSNFILSNIYIIRSNIKDNNIQIFFFV